MRHGPLPKIGFALTALGLLGAPVPCRAQDPVAATIERRVATLRSAPSLAFGVDTLSADPMLIAAYEGARFAPLWSGVAARGELLRLIDDLRADGLDPDAYHRASVATASAEATTVERVAELDLIRTAALLEVLRDLSIGRLRPELSSIGAELRATPAGPTPAALRAMIAPGRLYDEAVAFRPHHFVYRGLVDGLANLRRIESEGGWEPLNGGPAMMRDSADARVPALRRRLLREGYVLGQSGAAQVFDAGLERAVRAFQHRHGLNEDGIVGDVTFRELNVPVTARIAQVRLSLERARWIRHDLPASFLAINIAGAKVYLVRDDSIAFEARAIVGKEYTKTPMFAADMRYIDLNPTWTVPPGIVGEILREVRRNPGYLQREGIRVLDRSGREVDPARIDFRRATGRSFPYVFEGKPGLRNPLGRVKLVFPNEYSVYLHDTPSRELFARETRTFSHGCIRVQDPVGLAELLLDDPNRWNREALEAAIEPGETRTILLPHPVPVLVFYWTASADPNGELHFYRDLYGRDAELLKELNGR